MDEKIFLERLNNIGGTAYIVGGWVRDTVMGREPRDKDYVVCGASEGAFVSAFPELKRTGKRFPVFRLEIDGVKCEAALARKEIKTAPGHNGFEMLYDENITIEEDLSRRDTTMNSMALAPVGGKIIDPHNGRADIGNKIVRATSERFTEDPIRALRAARQAAQFGFTIEPATIELMRKCAAELAGEEKRLIKDEVQKALLLQNYVMFYKWLKKAELHSLVFS